MAPACDAGVPRVCGTLAFPLPGQLWLRHLGERGRRPRRLGPCRARGRPGGAPFLGLLGMEPAVEISPPPAPSLSSCLSSEYVYVRRSQQWRRAALCLEVGLLGPRLCGAPLGPGGGLPVRTPDRRTCVGDRVEPRWSGAWSPSSRHGDPARSLSQFVLAR